MSYRLVPTSFTLPTDDVRMLCVSGTESGRIFLGGEDGCLYEMTYEGRVPDYLLQHANGINLPVEEYLDQFYDEGKPVPEVITTDARDIVTTSEAMSLGKRVWKSAMSSTTPAQDGSQPRKCRKLNRTAHASSLVSAVLPDFVTRGASFIFGGKTSTGGGRIVQMVVDEPRQTLYTLSSSGWICAFDLRGGARLASVMDATKTARLYLEAVSRGQMYPPQTHHHTAVGNILFPGGSGSAKAGVGGMDGARTILKAADVPDRRPRNGHRSTSNNVLRPVQIHIVDPSESSRLTVVAVTSGGLRLYLSSLREQVINQGPTLVLQSSTFLRRSASSILAPASRMTLCHIRASPTDLETLSTPAALVGGVTPRMSSMPPSHVDASLYKHGSLLVAVEHQNPSSGRAAPVGDILVAASPDGVARPFTTTTRHDDDDKSKKDKLYAPDGISETISLPMSSAYGTIDNSATIPGGLVWDIALMPSERESAILRLAYNSQTPSDTELAVGLPPAYFPPSKVRSRTMGTVPSFRGEQSSSRAIVSADASLSSTAFSVLGSVISNVFLSRPLRSAISTAGGAVLPENQQCYRLSKRDGLKGFSATASETTRRVQTTSRGRLSQSSGSPTPKSARLRPWLLQPAQVPLADVSTEHLASTRNVVALNAGGLHYFQGETVLERFASFVALSEETESFASDASITNFFKSYGYKEGCVMCLALAVGSGPAAGNSTYSEQLRQKAIIAVLNRALRPHLIAQVDQPNGNGGTFVGSMPSSRDSLTPPGYDFEPSALSEGLTALSSRLLRPIWHKPVVVVTEGPCIRRQWSAGTRVLPAKVEVLIDESSVAEICRPLRNLLGVMKSKLSPAIVKVPGMPSSQDMQIDGNKESTPLIQALQYNSHPQAGQNGVASQLTPAEAEHIARLIEEKSIHSLYRLLARVVQLLDLITLLRRAQASSELREVDWGLLHGLTIAQLVQTSEGQDRLESLLNALVTASASDQSALSAQTDELANMFAEQCYLFFSPGSRYAFFGLRQASRAMSYHTASSERTHLARQAAQFFRQAGQHWHSASLIAGRILHRKGKETYSQVAQRAIQYGSPLASAVGALIALGDAASAVQICLEVASNFKKNTKAKGHASDALGQTHQYELAWEQNLYHKPRDPVENGSSGDTGGALSNTSPSSQIVAFGADVTSQDAVETCYALIFHYLSLLLKSNNQNLAIAMVSECAGSTDSEFLEALFLHLLESDNGDTLLRINSPELETWLRERRDTDLLWKYFSIQKRHLDAGQVLQEKGKDSTTNTPLDVRIEYLSKALNSLKTELVVEQRTARFNVSANGGLAQMVKDVEETLRVARIQNRILHQLDNLGSNSPPEITNDMRERLQTSLVPVTDLYNDYACTLELYEYCLRILHVCRKEDTEAIKVLWMHIISKELLPCTTRTETAYNFLKSFVFEIGRQDEVRMGIDGNLAVFENGDWINRLEGKLVALGGELYGTGADYVFPVDFLLFHLERKFLVLSSPVCVRLLTMCC